MKKPNRHLNIPTEILNVLQAYIDSQVEDHLYDLIYTSDEKKAEIIRQKMGTLSSFGVVLNDTYLHISHSMEDGRIDKGLFDKYTSITGDYIDSCSLFEAL